MAAENPTPPVIFRSAKFDSGVPASLCLLLGRFTVIVGASFHTGSDTHDLPG